MISVLEIKQKAERKYKDFLRHKINCVCGLIDEQSDGKDFFPLKIKSDKGNTSDLLKYADSIRLLYQKSKDKTGFGFSLDFEQVNTRANGLQDKLKNILFETENDYLLFIKKANETKRLENAINVLKEQLSINNYELSKWAVYHAEELQKSYEKDYWQNICICVNWLKENPNSNLYIREIPLQVHTKFIEENKALIASLLFQDPIKDFETNFGLKQKQKSVRFRKLDGTILLAENFSVNEISLPLEDFARLNESSFLRKIKNILIVENEMVFLTFPKVDNTLCIWGSGFSVLQLKQCQWLFDFNILYFGDLDEHGFNILSDFRKYFTNTKSFCMDMKTLIAFGEFRCKGEQLKKIDEIKNLTHEEMLVFNELKSNPNKNRLEQERISLEYIREQLGTAL